VHAGKFDVCVIQCTDDGFARDATRLHSVDAIHTRGVDVLQVRRR